MYTIIQINNRKLVIPAIKNDHGTTARADGLSFEHQYLNYSTHAATKPRRIIIYTTA